jgi:hypothetical protein
MQPTICIACGEPINALGSYSRNPNICFNCSSILDGFDDRSDLFDVESETQAGAAPETAVPVELFAKPEASIPSTAGRATR